MQASNVDLEGEGLTLNLAEQALRIFRAPLPQPLRDHTKLLILDHVGIALRGATLPWGHALTARSRGYSAAGTASVYGTTVRTAAPIAAMANATAAHGLEMDDTHDASITHPGAVVIAAALALSTDIRSEPDDLLRAIVAGYEVVARLGMATGADDAIERGFHPTALFAGFGAATVGGLLRGFDAEQLARSWGLLLSMAGGSMQFSEDPFGTTVKRLHGGYGAHNGLVAAELAALGIDGPLDAFAGRYGLCRNFGSSPDLSKLVAKEGERLEIFEVSIKPYPCCRLFHSTLDGLRELTDDFSLPASVIKEVRVGGPRIVVTQHMLRRPTSVMAAQYNLPHIVAAALTYGPTAYEGYTEDKLADPSMLSIADRVEAEVSPKMEQLFPARAGTWIALTLTSGVTRRTEVVDSIGTPRRPIDWSGIVEKLTDLNRGVYDEADVAALSNAVATMDSVGGVARLLEAIGGIQPRAASAA